jgi:hypothetical protein
MTSGKIPLEIGHERGFLGTLGGALVHAGVEIVDHPVIRDPHVDGKGPTIDQNDAELAKASIGTAIVDEGRDEECPARLSFEEVQERFRLVDLSQSLAGMRIERTHQQRKVESRTALPARQRLNLSAIETIRQRHDQSRPTLEPLTRPITRHIENPARIVQYRTRPVAQTGRPGFEQRPVGLRFPNGDEQQIMLGDLGRIRRVGRHIVEIEFDVAPIEQTFDRHIGHDRARRHERQQSEPRWTGRGGNPIRPLLPERLTLEPQPHLRLAETLQDDGRIQQRRAVARIVRCALQQRLTEGRQILARQREPQPFSETEKGRHGRFSLYCTRNPP